MLAQDIRHLPVLSGSHFVGIIGDRNLLAAAPSRALMPVPGESAPTLDSIPVEAHMTIDLVTMSPDTDTVLAAQLLCDHKIGSLPVVKVRRLVGIVTEIDLLRTLPVRHTANTVSSCMQPYVIKMQLDDPISAF